MIDVTDAGCRRLGFATAFSLTRPTPAGSPVLPETQTHYGKGDTLRVVELFATIGPRCCNPVGLRDALLRWHGMTHTVIRSAGLSDPGAQPWAPKPRPPSRN